MWHPMQIRHRSAYYDAFFTEALLAYTETGLASSNQAAASRKAIDEMVEFCLVTSKEEVRAQGGRTMLRRQKLRRHHRAGAAAASALQQVLLPDQAGPRLRHLRAGLRYHRLFVLGRDPGRLDRSDPRPAAARLLCRLPGRRRQQRAARHRAAQRQHRLRGRHRHLDRQPRRRAALRQRPRSDAQSRRARGRRSATLRAGR